MGAHEAGAGEQHNFTRGDLCLSQTSSSGRRWEHLCDPTTTSKQPRISPAPEELAKPNGVCLKVWAVKNRNLICGEFETGKEEPGKGEGKDLTA